MLYSFQYTTADIVFIVKDKPHPRFRREGANLIYTAKMPLGRALTGCTVSVHTLDEKILHIPITDIVRYVWPRIWHVVYNLASLNTADTNNKLAFICLPYIAVSLLGVNYRV